MLLFTAVFLFIRALPDSHRGFIGMCPRRGALSDALASFNRCDFVTGALAHSASSDVTSAGLRGKFGPELQYIMQHTACSRQRRDMWVGSFFLVWNASHPLSLKKLKMYVYFFTNPASSPFNKHISFILLISNNMKN